MREAIEARLRTNLARVRAILLAYHDRAGRGRGRRAVKTVDLLRAAVVFLHATLEDVLRSGLSWKWPETRSRAHLTGVPMLGHAPGSKVSLADLVPHRGASVDELIRRSVDAHLDRMSFNNVADIKNAIARMGIDPLVVAPYERRLATMTARRHSIVHRADRADTAGPGHHAATSLPHRVVAKWVDAVEAVCSNVIARL